jgi:putative Holliday junction resolvase
MGRVVGIDPGTKRIGVAVSDSARSMAFARPSVDAGADAISKIVGVVNAEGADLVVVGRPLALSGHVTSSTLLADEFRQQLGSALEPIMVVDFDERLTTVSASRSLSSAGVSTRDQRELIDSAAAAVLLQTFLDSHAT